MKRTYQYTVKKLVPCSLCGGEGERTVEGNTYECARCRGKGETYKTVTKKDEPQYKKGSWLI